MSGDIATRIGSTPPATRLLVALWAITQVVVPAALLFHPDRPARFGWQMFSNVGALPSLIAHRQGLPPDTVDLGVYLVGRRSEIGAAVAARLPPLLCARDSTVNELSVRRARDSVASVIRCESY